MLPRQAVGSEEHVRRLLDARAIELVFGRERVDSRFDSISDGVETYAAKFGPVVKARAARRPALRGGLARLFERHNAARDGTLAFAGEYLVVIGRRG